MSKPAARREDEAPSEIQPLTWPEEWVRALSDASLRQASSATIFQCGKAYAASGAVEVVNEDPMPEPALHAQVTGTDRPPYSAHYGSASVPTGERDVSLRAEVLCAERRWSEACALVQPPAVCRDGVLSQIARRLPSEQGDQALALLLRVFDSAMRRSSSPYRDELAMVQDIGRRMDPARRTAWLAQLRTEFKAKRNSVRDLPER